MAEAGVPSSDYDEPVPVKRFIAGLLAGALIGGFTVIILRWPPVMRQSAPAAPPDNAAELHLAAAPTNASTHETNPVGRILTHGQCKRSRRRGGVAERRP